MLLRTVDFSKLLVSGKLLGIFNIISAHYERLFKDLQTQIHGEAVTGLLLIYPVHIIHVIEVREISFAKLCVPCIQYFDLLIYVSHVYILFTLFNICSCIIFLTFDNLFSLSSFKSSK